MTPAQRRLLVASLVGDIGAVRSLVDAVDATERIDIDAIVNAARGAAVSAVVADALVQAGVPAARIPAALWDDLVQTGLQNQLLLTDAADVTRALADADVPCILMKGSALAILNDRMARLRHMDDIDVLVPADALPGARAALVARGHTDDDLLTSPRGTSIDLHTRTPGARLDFAALHPHTVARELHGVTVRVVTPDALLEQLTMHVVVHHGALPRYWPRHLVDHAALSPSSPLPVVTPLPPHPGETLLLPHPISRDRERGSQSGRAALALARAVHRAALQDVAGRTHLLSSLFVFPTSARTAVVGAACLTIKAVDILAEHGLGADAVRRALQPGVVPIGARLRGVAQRWLAR